MQITCGVEGISKPPNHLTWISKLYRLLFSSSCSSTSSYYKLQILQVHLIFKKSVVATTELSALPDVLVGRRDSWFTNTRDLQCLTQYTRTSQYPPVANICLPKEPAALAFDSQLSSANFSFTRNLETQVDHLVMSSGALLHQAFFFTYRTCHCSRLQLQRHASILVQYIVTFMDDASIVGDSKKISSLQSCTYSLTRSSSRYEAEEQLVRLASPQRR